MWFGYCICWHYGGCLHTRIKIWKRTMEVKELKVDIAYVKYLLHLFS